MTVYRLIGPRVLVRGSIDEVLRALSLEIDPDVFYWFDDREDLTGVELLQRLIALKTGLDAPHTYTDAVAFGRSLDGHAGEFRIIRVPPDDEVVPRLS